MTTGYFGGHVFFLFVGKEDREVDPQEPFPWRTYSKSLPTYSIDYDTLLNGEVIDFGCK